MSSKVIVSLEELTYRVQGGNSWEFSRRSAIYALANDRPNARRRWVSRRIACPQPRAVAAAVISSRSNPAD
jgi:hypothetical protein